MEGPWEGDEGFLGGNWGGKKEGPWEAVKGLVEVLEGMEVGAEVMEGLGHKAGISAVKEGALDWE